MFRVCSLNRTLYIPDVGSVYKYYVLSFLQINLERRKLALEYLEKKKTYMPSQALLKTGVQLNVCL